MLRLLVQKRIRFLAFRRAVWQAAAGRAVLWGGNRRLIVAAARATMRGQLLLYERDAMKKPGGYLLAIVLLSACATASTQSSDESPDTATSERSAAEPSSDETSSAESEDEASEQGDTPASVSFSFDWPAKLEGRLQLERSRLLEVKGEQPRDKVQSAAFVVRAEPGPGETIDVRTIVASLADAPVPDEGDGRREYAARYYKAMWMPPIRVGAKTGAIEKVIDMELAELGHEATVDGFSISSPRDKAAFEGAMSNFRPSAVALAMAQKKWNPWVAFWHDSKLETGISYEVEPGKGLPKITFSVFQRLPCDTSASVSEEIEVPDNAARGCAELYIEHPVAIEQINAMMKPMLARLSGGEDVEVEHISGTETTSVITDPDTLIPYSFQMQRTMTMRIAVDDETSEVTVTSTESGDFVWANGAPGGDVL
jgi:hypothetical protein